MAAPRDWANAYLAQARADLCAAKTLKTREGARSVLAMLLQMTVEKLAKAALLRSGQTTLAKATTSHVAASPMVQVLERNREMLASLGSGNQHAWKDVLPIVRELERTHPQVAASGPHLEYPWESTTNGTVLWPERDLQIARQLATPQSLVGERVIKFAERLSDRFDDIF